MRLRLLALTIACLSCLALTSQAVSAAACCENKCGVTEECKFRNYFSQSEWFPACLSGQQIAITCNADTDGQVTYYDKDNPHTPNWTPYGSPGTQCTYGCVLGGSSPSGGYVEETKDIYCGDCSGGSGGSGGVGGGGGGGSTPTPTATPTGPVLVSGSVQTDVNAALSGAYCAQASANPLSLAGISVNANNIANNFTVTPSGGTWSLDTAGAGSNYTVTLDLTAQTGGSNYVCSCPAPLNPANPYVCRYTGVSAPTANVNFYLREGFRT